MQVSVRDYMERAKKKTSLSPRTINNYEIAIHACGLDNFIIDTTNMDHVWLHLTEKLRAGVSHFHVRLGVILVRATMNLHGEEYRKGIHYRDLITEINRRIGIPKAYSDEQIAWLLQNTQVIKSNEDTGQLWRACMLMAYSGLRIGGCQGLYYNKFQFHPEFHCYTFPVHSKGKDYIAAIAEHAFKFICQNDTRYTEGCNIEVVKSPPKGKFDSHYREKLTKILHDKVNMDLKNDKSIFHSIRKWHSDKLLESPLSDEARGLLLGHTPDSIAFVHYTTEKGISMHKRIAELYAKTVFVKFDFMMRKEKGVETA